MKFLLSIILIFVFYGLAFSQIKWYGTPIVKEKGDSICYQLTTKHYFDYFYQRIDSISNSINSDTANSIVQLVVVHKISRNGHLLIIYKGKTHVKYELKEYKLNGMGAVYNSFIPSTIAIPIIQGQFKNGLLNGFYIINFHSTGELLALLWYKKGKLRKVLYGNGHTEKYFKIHYNYP